MHLFNHQAHIGQKEESWWARNVVRPWAEKTGINQYAGTPDYFTEEEKLLIGFLGSGGLGRLPSATGRLTVTKPNINVDGKALCLADSLCAMTTTKSGAVVLDGTVDDVVRGIR